MWWLATKVLQPLWIRILVLFNQPKLSKKFSLKVSYWKFQGTHIIFVKQKSLKTPKVFLSNERVQYWVSRVLQWVLRGQVWRTALFVTISGSSKATHENFGSFDHCVCGHVHHGYFWKLECLLCHTQNTINEIRHKLLPLFLGSIRLINTAFRYSSKTVFLGVDNFYCWLLTFSVQSIFVCVKKLLFLLREFSRVFDFRNFDFDE